jgi:hypothetical protein
VRELPLVNGTMVWDGRDRAGLALPAGAYFARTTASDVPQVLRVVKTQ